MKKFVSSLLIFSMIFTGAAVTSCFADKSYQADYTVTNGSIPLNFNIAVTANGGRGGHAKSEATAEAKADANSSGRSKLATIVKIFLAISAILAAKKYCNAALDKLQPMLEEVKSMFKDLPQNVKDQFESLKVKVVGSGETGESSYISHVIDVSKETLSNARMSASEFASRASKILGNRNFKESILLPLS